MYYAVLSALQGEDRHPTLTFAPPAPPPRPAAESPGNAAQGLQGGQVPGTPPRPPCRGRWPRNTPPVHPAVPLVHRGFPKIREESTVLGRNVDKPVENVEKPRKPLPRRRVHPAVHPPCPGAGELDVPHPPRRRCRRETPEAPEPAEVPWRLAGRCCRPTSSWSRGRDPSHRQARRPRADEFLTG